MPHDEKIIKMTVDLECSILKFAYVVAVEDDSWWKLKWCQNNLWYLSLPKKHAWFFDEEFIFLAISPLNILQPIELLQVYLIKIILIHCLFD